MSQTPLPPRLGGCSHTTSTLNCYIFLHYHHIKIIWNVAKISGRIYIQYVSLISLLIVPFMVIHSLKIVCYGIPQYKIPSGIEQEEEENVESHDTDTGHSLENEERQETSGIEQDNSSDDIEMLDAILTDDNDENIDNDDIQLLIAD